MNWKSILKVIAVAAVGGAVNVLTSGGPVTGKSLGVGAGIGVGALFVRRPDLFGLPADQPASQAQEAQLPPAEPKQ